MKKSFLFFISVCFSMLLPAQTYFIVKAGMGISAFYGTEKEDMSAFGGNPRYVGYNSQMAWKAGITMELPITYALAFTPGLYYWVAGVKTDECNLYLDNEQYKVKGTVHLNYIQLPLTMQWRFVVPNNFNVAPFAGLYFAWGIGGKTTVDIWRDNYNRSSHTVWENDSFKNFLIDDKRTDGYKTYDMGLNAGVNLEFNHFVMGVNMDLGFLETRENDKGKNVGVVFMLGYRF